MANQSSNSERGFASMDEDKQREIASKGGVASHERGSAHEFTPEEAREAGRKGGEAVSQDREHMAEIGRNAMLPDFGLQAYAGFPLLAEGRAVGVLYALDQKVRDYSDEDLDFLSTLAQRAATAISKVQLYESLQAAKEIAEAQRLYGPSAWLHQALGELAERRRSWDEAKRQGELARAAWRNAQGATLPRS